MNIQHFGAKAKLAACGFALIGLAGCATPPGEKSAAAPVLPTERFSAKVAEAPDQVALAIHADGLSVHQRAALAAFIGRWRAEGDGPVLLKSPSDAADAEQAKAMTRAVQAQLEALGVPSERIQLADYQSTDGRGPVLASFESLAVQVPNCGGGWGSLTSTMSNEPYSHFGCSLTANMAAQVADPRDLVAPPTLAPGDNTRRQVVLTKYRDGKVTASERDVQASGAVSTAVQQ